MYRRIIILDIEKLFGLCEVCIYNLESTRYAIRISSLCKNMEAQNNVTCPRNLDKFSPIFISVIFFPLHYEDRHRPKPSFMMAVTPPRNLRNLFHSFQSPIQRSPIHPIMHNTHQRPIDRTRCRFSLSLPINPSHPTHKIHTDILIPSIASVCDRINSAWTPEPQLHRNL